MKTTYIPNYLCLTAILLLANCLGGWAEDLESLKKKEINQSFNVGASDQLNVDNKYGSITVTYWDKNEVSIRVVVESKARNDRAAQEELDRIDISLSKSGNTIYAITSIRNRVGGGDSQFTIRYFVNMPSKLKASITQKYGDINMPDNNDGKYNLEVKYGNIHAGNFSQALTLEAGYSNIVLGNAVEAHIEARYCGGIKLNNVADLEIDCKYSNLNLRDAGNLKVENSYGNIKAENVNNLSISTRYGDANIEYIKETLSATTLNYSSMNIGKLDAAFKSVSADARYGTLKIKIPGQASFRIYAEGMKYGNLSINGLTITETNINNKTNYYYQVNAGGNGSIRFNGNGYGNLHVSAL
ncbi:MAG: hypothetical protein LBJ39_05230 [Tannerellaceae bacterium]|jgi:hypothetical protein|nr:hypothetical protein [Tannerellaceae bacterium]